MIITTCCKVQGTLFIFSNDLHEKRNLKKKSRYTYNLLTVHLKHNYINYIPIKKKTQKNIYTLPLQHYSQQSRHRNNQNVHSRINQ